MYSFCSIAGRFFKNLLNFRIIMVHIHVLKMKFMVKNCYGQQFCAISKTHSWGDELYFT